MIKPNDKLKYIPFSPIRKIFNRVNVLKSQGEEIISLGIGEPDFDTPTHISEAMFNATRNGATHYTPNKGILELRKAISKNLLKDSNLVYDPEEIICTVGVSEGLYIALTAFLNPEDEVLVPDPAWLNYGHITTLSGAKTVYYSLTAGNGFQIDSTELENLITDKTKAVIILDPSNPTGSILTEESLRNVAKLAKEHDLLVISDEIYEKIIYDGNKHYSIATLPDMRERTIILNGFAKAYAMTGWRLGYLAAPENLIQPMAKIHSYLVTSASSMVQYGGVAAIEGTQKPLEDMVEEFRIRRDYVYNEINSIKGLSCVKPGGAFYMFVDVRGTGLVGEEFAEYLLNKAGVAVVPGTAFGKRATYEVRISYATSMDNLKKAMNNIRNACEKLLI